MRFTRVRRTVLSLLAVCLAYGIYALCVVPFVEPDAPQELNAEPISSGLSSSATDQYVRELTPLFPEGSWELDNPKVLRSDQATILLQEFEELDDGRLHVRPCSIVLYGSTRDQNDGGPTIMQAPQGAILAFDKPLDLSSGDFGKPVSGQLVGGIRIVRVGSQDTEDLELVTSNIVISNKQIWTRDQVSFRLGNAYGTGSELLITRAQDDAKKESKSRKLFDDLGTIELQQVQRLSFRMDQDDLFDSFSNKETSSEPTGNGGDALAGGKAKPPVKIEVRCQGPMIFDLNRMKATLEDQVTVARQESGKHADTLFASNLSMYFARKKVEEKKSSPEAIPKKKRASTLEMTRLVAEGKPLVIDAKSKQAFLEGKRLEYDFSSRNLKLFGANPFATQKTVDASIGRVRLHGPTYQVAAPSIEFHNHEDRKKWQLHAEGAGSFDGSFDGKNRVKATWTKELSLQPQRGHQVLQVVGDARVETPEAGTIGAEIVELWLQQMSRHVSTRLDGSPVHKTIAVPLKLVTQSKPGGHVLIKSEQFEGTLSSMEVFFQPNPNPAPPDSELNPLLSSSGSGRESQDDGKSESLKENGKFTVQGGALSAWVDPDTRDVHRMIVKGHSRIVEQTIAGQRPFQLNGELIDLMIVAGVPVAQLTGSPARVGSSDMDASGNRIEFDGTQNVIHIPGSGSLTIQASSELWSKFDAMATDAKPQAVRPPRGQQQQPVVLQPINIAWQQGLHFDGRDVSVSGNVQAKGEDISFKAADLKITLDRVIDLSDPNAAKVRPKLKFVTARGGVSSAIKSRDQSNAMKSFQQVAAQDLDVDFQTGEVTANGPGRLSYTSYGKLSTSITTGDATQSGAADSTDELNLLSIAFRTQLQGNMKRGELHLHDNIQMWTGPVPDWNASLDPTERVALRKDDVLMSCHELFVIESPTAAPSQKRKPIELLARGEAYVEGQLFAAKGHQIKYAEEKGMMTLEGDVNRPAQLWQRKSANERGMSQGRVRRIRFWPKTGKATLDGFLRFDVSSAPKVPAK